jgi:predicted NAD/FAD-binding protein
VKIAVIGAGISGLACAAQLSPRHAVTLYEANSYLGGHTHTVEASLDGVTYPVDTGFLVFNHRTYPHLVELFKDLGVPTAASEMSFSVRVDGARESLLEWAGNDLNSVFAQRANLLRPRFLRMLADIVRFNRAATRLAQAIDVDTSATALGHYLDAEGYSQAFRDWYLLPMAGAIWSCPTAQMNAFPLATFVRFCHNHGLLQIVDRPQWYTVVGGGREYVRRLAARVQNVRLDPVVRVLRGNAKGVEVRSRDGLDQFDEVVLACHSDQALALLGQPSEAERAVLGAIRYQPNRALLHSDASVLPHARRAWAAWNYQYAPGASDASGPAVHYLINRLQPVPFKRALIVSLNAVSAPRADTVQGEFSYAHPVFDAAAVAAQRRLPAIQGEQHTWFAGAWTGYGFHEDGLRSGLSVAAGLERSAPLHELAAAS